MARSWLYGFRDAHHPAEHRQERRTTIDGGSSTAAPRHPHPRSHSLPHLMTAATSSGGSTDIESIQPTTPSKKGVGKPTVSVKSWRAALCGKAKVALMASVVAFSIVAWSFTFLGGNNARSSLFRLSLTTVTHSSTSADTGASPVASTHAVQTERLSDSLASDLYGLQPFIDHSASTGGSTITPVGLPDTGTTSSPELALLEQSSHPTAAAMIADSLEQTPLEPALHMAAPPMNAVYVSAHHGSELSTTAGRLESSKASTLQDAPLPQYRPPMEHRMAAAQLENEGLHSGISEARELSDSWQEAGGQVQGLADLEGKPALAAVLGLRARQIGDFEHELELDSELATDKAGITTGCPGEAAAAAAGPGAADAFNLLTAVPWDALRPVLDWPTHSITSATAAKLEFSLHGDAAKEPGSLLSTLTGVSAATASAIDEPFSDVILDVSKGPSEEIQEQVDEEVENVTGTAGDVVLPAAVDAHGIQATAAEATDASEVSRSGDKVSLDDDGDDDDDVPHNFPLCNLLAPHAAKSIFIVGNGPISNDDRAAMGAADWVIRFNAVDNFLPVERMDLWVARTDLAVLAPAAVLPQLLASPEAATIAAVHHKLLLGTPTSLQPQVLDETYGRSLNLSSASHVTTEAFAAAFEARIDRKLAWSNTAMPTTGFMVALATAACLTIQPAQLTLVGFNFAAQQLLALHDPASEDRIIRELKVAGHLKLKPTCGKRLRVCDAALDGPLCRAASSSCATLPTTQLSNILKVFKLPELVALYKQKLEVPQMGPEAVAPSLAPAGPSLNGSDASFPLNTTVADTQKRGISSAEDPQSDASAGAVKARRAFTQPQSARELLSAATALGFRFASEDDDLIAIETADTTSQIDTATNDVPDSDPTATDTKVDREASDGVSAPPQHETSETMSQIREPSMALTASGKIEGVTSNDTRPFDMSRLWGWVGDAGTHKGSPLCSLFRKDGVPDHKLRIGVVGGALLSEDQKKQLRSFDIVVRMNSMSNREPEDITTLWLSRFTTEGGSYAGLQSSRKALGAALSAGQPSVALIGGGAHHVRQLLGRTPQLPLSRAVWVPTDDAEEQLAAVLSELDPSLTGTPKLSTGFIGVVAALSCKPSVSSALHVFGLDMQRAAASVAKLRTSRGDIADSATFMAAVEHTALLSMAAEGWFTLHALPEQ